MVKGSCVCGRRGGGRVWQRQSGCRAEGRRDEQRGTPQLRDTAAIAADLGDAHDNRSDRVAHVIIKVTALQLAQVR